MLESHAIADVVLLYAPPWSGPTRFSKHHLARYFASRGSRVLYVEAPLSPLGVRRGRAFVGELRHALHQPTRVEDGLWVRRHFLPLPYHAASWLTSRRAANRLGQRLLAPVIRRDLIRLGFVRPILIAGLPHAVDVVPFLPRRALVYHCADDYAHAKGFPFTLPELEAELCRRADLVITTSESLCEGRRRFNPHTHWVPNGVDLEHFSVRTAPAAELRHLGMGMGMGLGLGLGLRKPVIGFVGGVSEWVDVDLIARLAEARPAWSFLIIGPVGTPVSALQHKANVMLLGARPYAELPAYLAAMDAALIPFKQQPLTFHADPIKAYEYLAAGLPVVATDLPSLRRLQHVIRLADSPEGFLSQIDAAVAEGRDAHRADRQVEAARHSWTSRFETVETLIRSIDASPVCAS